MEPESRAPRSRLSIALAVAALAVLPAACSSSSKSRSPKEIQDYKLEVLADNAEDLAPEQRAFVLMSPARSFADVDKALERAEVEFPRAEAARARAAEDGIEIGSRRRVGEYEWVRSGEDNLVRQPRPAGAPPVQPSQSAPSGDGGSGGAEEAPDS